jgi:hypothetical protein
MSGLSTWHWIIVLVYFVAVTIPFFKLFPRAGIPGWVGIFAVIPLVALLFLWILAFKDWPQDRLTEGPASAGS